MRQIFDDVWRYYTPEANHTKICITTNGMLNNKNEAIMGRGIALDAKMRFPWMPKVLGNMILTNGNNVHYVGLNLISFPTKHDWRSPSDIKLIMKSCQQLMTMKMMYNWDYIILPRPGCENGRLSWDEVSAAISVILDDSIYIISKGDVQ